MIEKVYPPGREAIESMVKSWPRWSAKAPIFHVGSLNPQDKQQRGESQEGPGVSFSPRPDAWVRIAKLGGLPWWKIEGALQGLNLINAHRLTQEQREELMNWGEAQKLIVKTTIFLIARHDDELNGIIHVIAHDRETAHAEAGDMDHGTWQRREPGPDEEGVFEVVRPMMTEPLKKAMGWNASSENAALTFDALILYAARQAGLDGVYFDDELNPSHYSAPRGVFFPETVPRLRWKHATSNSRRERSNYDAAVKKFCHYVEEGNIDGMRSLLEKMDKEQRNDLMGEVKLHRALMWQPTLKKRQALDWLIEQPVDIHRLHTSHYDSDEDHRVNFLDRWKSLYGGFFAGDDQRIGRMVELGFFPPRIKEQLFSRVSRGVTNWGSENTLNMVKAAVASGFQPSETDATDSVTKLIKAAAYSKNKILNAHFFELFDLLSQFVTDKGEIMRYLIEENTVSIQLLENLAQQNPQWLDEIEKNPLHLQRGRNCLHIATFYDHREAILCCLRHGANPNILDGKGRPAEHPLIDQWLEQEKLVILAKSHQNDCSTQPPKQDASFLKQRKV